MDLKFRKFQEGGAMPTEAEAQAAPQDQGGAPEQGGQDPMAQLLQAAAQAIQGQDCQTALQVCQMLVQMAQQGAGAAPEEGTAEEGEPVYAKKGAKLIRRIKKCK